MHIGGKDCRLRRKSFRWSKQNKEVKEVIKENCEDGRLNSKMQSISEESLILVGHYYTPEDRRK